MVGEIKMSNETENIPPICDECKNKGWTCEIVKYECLKKIVFTNNIPELYKGFEDNFRTIESFGINYLENAGENTLEQMALARIVLNLNERLKKLELKKDGE